MILLVLQKDIKKGRKHADVTKEARLRAMADPDRMWQLRMKFLEQLQKYFGVPYAKRYWKPDGKSAAVRELVCSPMFFVM